MPIYELQCQRCKQIEQRLYPSWEAFCKEPAVRCLADGSRMERIQSQTAFTVTGFNAANHYGVKKS